MYILLKGLWHKRYLSIKFRKMFFLPPVLLAPVAPELLSDLTTQIM